MSVLGAVASLPEAAIGLITAHGHKAGVNGTSSTRLGAPAQRAEATTASGSSGSAASGTTSSSATDIGTTFLSLLVKELQNQDPTAPMDSTAMVGQMISLNQLDQLIAINQAVQPATAASTTGAGGTSGGGQQQAHAVSGGSSAVSLAARAALQAAMPASSGGNSLAPISSDATLQAAAASASNAGVLNLNSLDSIFGGK